MLYENIGALLIREKVITYVRKYKLFENYFIFRFTKS